MKKLSSFTTEENTQVTKPVNEFYDDITTVSDNIDDVITTVTSIGSINTVSSNIDDVNTVSDDIANVNIVATNIGDVNTVLDDIANVNIVATNIGDVNTVADDIAKVIKVADDLNEAISEVETVADDLNETVSEIEVVANNITDVNTVASSITSINSVAADKATLDSLFADKATLDSLFADKATLDSLYADKLTLDSLFADKLQFDTIYANMAEILLADTNAANATAQATIATNEAVAAAASAAAALTSKINAALSESAAASSETAAASSETSAATSAATATTQATTATTQAGIATTAATNASASETAAAGSASAAATSASNASTSESNALLHKQDAEAAKVAAELIYDTFDDRFLGTFTVDPTLDNDGNALQVGATYWNSTENEQRFYTGTVWERPSYTATQAAATATTQAGNALTSANAAAVSESSAATSAANAATSETNASSSATSASDSASTATTQAGIATTQATNASNSATASATSASSAATSESNASTSESNAATSATQAANSATEASGYATTAGTYDATYQSYLSDTEDARDAAQLAQTGAETAETNASTYASNASTSASDAATSETNASNSASAAATSATNASTSETNASNSATSASGSASTATTQAGIATTKASEASTSAANALTSENNASDSEDAASTSASAAASSASSASTSASNASTSATNASNSATSAASSASSASSSASTATTQASNAASSANAAGTAQLAAEAARDSALAAYDSFDDRYLGAKASEPTTDNDGNPLVAGTLYFDTTTEFMKLYTGSEWVSAYVSAQGALFAANNLSDLADASTARINLGLGTAATTNSTAYEPADATILKDADIGSTVQSYDINTVIDGSYVHTDNNYTTTEKNKLAGIDTGANNYSLPVASGTTIGGIKSGADITVDASGNVSVNDDSHNHTIANVDGLQTALDGKVDDSQVLTNVPAGAVFTDTVYTHPTHPGDDMAVDTGALSGATVISDLDFNVTTDTQGHVTDANATYSTRNLTYSDVGAAAASHSHSYLPLTGGTLTGDLALTGTNPHIRWVPSGANDAAGIRFNYSNNDGVMEFWTSDDYTEPFVWRAYDIGLEGLGTYQEWMKLQSNALYVGGQRAFTDGYHPNADKWTTARTLSLTGDVTGSVSWDGSGNASLSTTVGNDSHFHSQVYIPDTRGAARAPSYYPDRYTSFDFQNTSDTGAGGDGWHVLQTIAPWSSYNDSHRQQQLAFTGTGGIKFRYATSDSAWAGWQTVWTSGNDGSGSGLDADTLDGLHESSFARKNGDAGQDFYTDDLYYDQWIRNNSTGASGLYWHNTSNDGYGWHIYPETRADMTLRTGSGNGGIKGTIADTTARGYVHWTTANEIGFLNASRSWSLRCDNNKNVQIYGSLTESSDSRLKENVETLENSLDVIQNLRGVSYNKIETPEKREVGFIAQEVEEIVPELVETDEEGMKSVSYARTVALLVEGMKEQQQQIEDLKKEINTLKGK